jgi:predicted nucleic acid-binding protein
MIDYWNKYSLRHFATKELLEKVIELDNVVLSAITKMELLMGAKDKEGLVK